MSAVPLCHGIGALRGLEMVEGVQQNTALLHEGTGVSGGFVVDAAPARIPAAVVEQEGDRVRAMAAGGRQCLMVAEQQEAVVQPRRLQTGDQRSRQTAVQPFDRLQLARQVPVMGTLIRGLDMSRWAVVACDQFTSQPEYWEEADRIAGDAPSAPDSEDVPGQVVRHSVVDGLDVFVHIAVIQLALRQDAVFCWTCCLRRKNCDPAGRMALRKTAAGSPAGCQSRKKQSNPPFPDSALIQHIFEGW